MMMLKNRVEPEKKEQKLELENFEKLKEEDNLRLEGKYTRYLLICVILASIGGGFHIGWSIASFNTPSEVIKTFYVEVLSLQGNFVSTNSSLINTLWAVTNGLIPAGGIIGGLCSGVIADHFGRKNGIIIVNLIVITSVILSIISKYVETFITVLISRFLAGIYTGIFTGITPLYVNECSSRNLRGLAGTISPLVTSMAILVANVMGLPVLLGTSELWPVLAAFTIIPVFAHAGLFFLPESPKFMLVFKKDKEKAREILMKLRDNDSELVENEIKEIEKEMRDVKSKTTWRDMVKIRKLRRAFIVVIALQMSQQLTGINAVSFYSTDIFIAAGLEGNWPVYSTILLGFVQLLMTIVCMFIVDRIGRKILLLTGLIGMSLSAYLLTVFRTYGLKNPAAEWLDYMTIIWAVLFVVCFAFGPGAIPWLITSEIFDTDSRGKATSVAGFVNWSSNFLVAVTFPFIEAAIGSYSFLIFGTIALVLSIFTAFFVPETKNKSIDQIAEGIEDAFKI